jgi:hypothetical protein
VTALSAVKALAAGCVDELTVIIALVLPGSGKRLFDGFTPSLDLEYRGVRQSPYATFIHYRVKRWVSRPPWWPRRGW